MTQQEVMAYFRDLGWTPKNAGGKTLYKTKADGRRYRLVFKDLVMRREVNSDEDKSLWVMVQSSYYKNIYKGEDGRLHLRAKKA